MARGANGVRVGDSKTPPLMATEIGLRGGVEQAHQIQTENSTQSSRGLILENLALSHSVASKNVTNCRQTLWVSLFFDGTGNNREADTNFKKHSNIAELFTVHKNDSVDGGIYSIYIPGVATYFAAVGDDGGSTSGKVAGAMGEARINFALMELDRKISRNLKTAQSPSHAIDEINIAVFGFSRGAALARAFSNALIETRCRILKGKLVLSNGDWPLRIRFMGLFDTVASVGQPMSSNTTNLIGAVRSDVQRMIRKRLASTKDIAPQLLAFTAHGTPGADPAPGSANGHDGYGGRLAIDDRVEESGILLLPMKSEIHSRWIASAS